MTNNELLQRLKQADHEGRTALDLADQELTGLPPEIGRLTSLQSLDLSRNRLGSLPPEIGRLTQLQSLVVRSNRLVNLPPEIGKLTRLQSLVLWGNRLVSLPPEIGQLTRLQSLDVYANQLVSLPPEIGRLTQLQSLYLRSNELVSLPPEIGRLTQLQSLVVRSNQLVSLPPEIGRLTRLQSLDLEANRLVSLPPEIGRLTPLQSLVLRSNQLVSLPPEIGRLTRLQSLDLEANQLGSLPPGVTELTSLQSLDLSRNRLSSLPPEIGRLTRLQSLDLEANQLGSLPPEIGRLTQLQSLNLEANRLVSLPPEIGQLTQLVSLTVESNLLDSLPPEIRTIVQWRTKRGRVLHSPSYSRIDRVTFSVFGPRVITAGHSFILDVWAHLPDQAEVVLALATQLERDKIRGIKTGILVNFGTILTVLIQIPSMRIDDPIDTMAWEAEPINCSFIIEAPSDAALGAHSGRAIITACGFPIAKVSFSLTVEASDVNRDETLKSIKAIQYKLRSAFASYSSLDRDEVFGRVQGMKKVLPELDIFLDVLSLRSGQDWEQQLRLHISEKDVFFLFWSLNASSSKEVDKEWRLALGVRGLDYIDPVPLVDPQTAPPPQELRSLHFNDMYLAYIQNCAARERLQR
jgi:Leucine-rich repeat (LRR) protein